MTSMPVLMLVRPDSLAIVNRTLEMFGRGPANVSVALVAIDNDTATHETPALWWCMQDMSAQDSDVAKWMALRDGVIQSVDDQDNPIVWGTSILPYTTDGGTPVACPSAVEVLAAWGGENVQIVARSTFSEDDDERPRANRPPTPTEWREETFAQESVKPPPL